MSRRKDETDIDDLKGATTNLALINLGVYVFTAIWSQNLILTADYVYPVLGISGIGLQYGLIWTPLTSIFTHSSISHLGGNLLFLFLYGFKMEERGYNENGIYFAYVSTGVMAGILAMIPLNPRVVSVGASGAVFGLLGTNVGVERREGDPNYKTILLASIVLFIFSNTSPNTNIFAHLFGLILGIILGSTEWYGKFKTEVDQHRLNKEKMKRQAESNW